METTQGVPPLPVFTYHVKDSEFRCFVVPVTHRSEVAMHLKSLAYAATSGYPGTLHHASLSSDAAPGTPCIHVVSVGGDAPPDIDGEPEHADIPPAISSAIAKDTAIVMWRRFGGTNLGVSNGGLVNAYGYVTQEGMRRFKIINSQPWMDFAMNSNRLIQSPQLGHSTVQGFPQWKNLACLLVPLPIPCAYCDQEFLPTPEADRLLAMLQNNVLWELPGKGSREERATALYSDVAYHNTDGKGYVSSNMISWSHAPRALHDLKRRAEEWHERHAGIAVKFNVCLLNRYQGGSDKLGWHSDREEIDPQQNAPRTSPIASISLGAERLFGFAPKWDGESASRVRELAQSFTSGDPKMHEAASAMLGEMNYAPVRLKHGSLCVMENVCQLLYKHSLLPEHSVSGPRINITFRSKSMPVAPAPVPAPFGRDTAGSPGGDGTVFVGLTQNTDHKHPQGWKDTLYHPFESPFIDDPPLLAAARYQTWLLAQPAFSTWVREQLFGRRVSYSATQRDDVHGRLLQAIASAPASLLMRCLPHEGTFARL